MTSDESATTRRAFDRDPADGSVDLMVHGRIANVELNRPAKLNALTLEMLDDLEQAIRTLDASAEVRVLVITSAGDRAFCAGADINRFKVLDGLAMWSTWTRRGHQVFDRLAELRQPTIAAIDGNAYGGGLELALACDLRVLAADSLLGLTEVGLGTVPGWGGTHRLPQQIGATRAKELILTGSPVSSSRAHDWGLVNTVVEREHVRAEAFKLAEQIAMRAPSAVQMAKQAVDVAMGNCSGSVLEGLAAAATAASADFSEGLAAFSERRQPEFQGQHAPMHVPASVRPELPNRYSPG